MSLPVLGYDVSEVVATGQLSQLIQSGADNAFWRSSTRTGFAEGASDEAFDHCAHRSAVRFGTGRHVAHQLAVKAPRLSSGCVQAPVGG